MKSLESTQTAGTTRTPYIAVLLVVTAVIVAGTFIDIFAPAHAFGDLLSATKFRGDPIFLAP